MIITALVDNSRVIQKIKTDNTPFFIEKPGQENVLINTEHMPDDLKERYNYAIPFHSMMSNTGFVTPLFDLKDTETITELLKDEFIILRSIRNLKLSESDWTQLGDVQFTEEKKQEWLNYRQALRDLPGNTPNPHLVVWPEKPL